MPFREYATRIEKLETQSQLLSEQLAENTAETIAAKENTAQIISLMESWQGAIRVLEAIGRVFKPIGYVALVFSAMAAGWASIKTGISPK